MAALPFYIAYIVPASALLALARGGWWSWSTVILVFGITPLLDAVVGVDTTNPRRERAGPPPPRDPVFDLAPWLWLPLQLVIVAWGTWLVGHAPPSAMELAGLALSVGISSGAGAINVAHELMHRRGRVERALAEILLATTSYPHFSIEHVRGHHRNVATPDDPASARYGESIVSFLARTLAASAASAWRLEANRVRSAGRGPLALGGRRMRYPLVLGLVLGGAWSVAGMRGVAFFLAQSTVAVVLLEIINYVEHHGLERRRLASGRWERVTPQHSWNAPYRLTNRYLFNLQRHADHHDVASRPYWLLRHIPDSPQLPAGYATMALLALAPQLWRRVMDPRVRTWRNHNRRDGGEASAPAATA